MNLRELELPENLVKQLSDPTSILITIPQDEGKQFVDYLLKYKPTHKSLSEIKITVLDDKKADLVKGLHE